MQMTSIITTVLNEWLCTWPVKSSIIIHNSFLRQSKINDNNVNNNNVYVNSARRIEYRNSVTTRGNFKKPKYGHEKPRKNPR